MLAKSEAVILDLLTSQGASYGLQLVDGSGGALKRGGIYVTLGRMEEKGLVTSAPGEGGRRLYEPTALGLRSLVAARILHGDLPLGAKA
jgi:PadR family transcriptional regulator, regulatory protein PadR